MNTSIFCYLSYIINQESPLSFHCRVEPLETRSTRRGANETVILNTIVKGPNSFARKFSVEADAMSDELSNIEQCKQGHLHFF